MITIPLPIPAPIIKVDGNQVSIDYTRTESAKRQREQGAFLTFDDEKSLPLCSACKEPESNYSTFEPPTGYRWGGWFCPSCLSQGKLANRYGFIIDQLTCTVENVIVFNKNGMPLNANS